MDWLQWLEASTYLVTILGLPVAIVVFFHQQRQARQNEENALHRTLSEEYDNFLKLVLDHADLQLIRAPDAKRELDDEQRERKHILFSILISLFEKAYIILYDDHMSKDTRRLWLSWEDDMRDWCRHTDFRAALPELLDGEDDAFSRHITKIAEQQVKA